MRRLYREAGRVAAWVPLILAALVASGCNRAVPLNPDVPTDKRILMLVGDVDDFAQSKNELGRIKQLFAPGSEPSPQALRRYMAYRYEGKPPVLSGDSATVAVMVKDAKTGSPAGEVQWSIAKVDGVWKLKDAPLPEGGK